MKKRYYVLILAFLFSIFVPNLIYLLVQNSVDTENKENRKLIEFPLLDASNWTTFPGRLDEYIDDHAAFKNQLMFLNSWLDITLFERTGSDDVTLGEDSWLFIKGESYTQYKKIEEITGAELELIRDNVLRMQQLCEEQGSQFVIFVAPNKEQVYTEYMPDSIKRREGKSREDIIIDYLRENTDVCILYPQEELVSARDTCEVYLQYDSHWNQIGAFIGTQQVMEAVTGTREYLENKEILEGKTTSGDLARLLNMESVYDDDVELGVSEYFPDVEAQLQEEDGMNYFHRFTSNSENSQKLLLIGDSFSVAMRRYLSKNFSESIFARREVYKPEMLSEYQADVVVYEVVERLLYSCLSQHLAEITTDK